MNYLNNKKQLQEMYLYSSDSARTLRTACPGTPNNVSGSFGLECQAVSRICMTHQYIIHFACKYTKRPPFHKEKRGLLFLCIRFLTKKRMPFPTHLAALRPFEPQQHSRHSRPISHTLV